MLKIWGRENSGNVKKALWCADELELPYEHINAGGPFGVVDTPEYRAMNPNGLVPCIQDDELTLWESNTIVRYLCARHNAGGLWPEDTAQRALAEQWMDWCTSTFATPFRDVFWNLVRLGPDQRDMVAVVEGRDACNAHLAIVDAALSSQPYLGGDAFTMADIPLGAFIHAWFHMPIQRDDLPHLQAWYDRLCERPAYQKRVVLPLT
jgi:glutathione S-transferase